MSRGPWTVEYDIGEGYEHPVEESEIERDDGIYRLDFGDIGTEADVTDVRDRMAWQYGCAPDEREMNITPVVNQYRRVGSIYFSLYGSPPKGHAIYIRDSQRVHFYGPHGKRYAEWKNVRSLAGQDTP